MAAGLPIVASAAGGIPELVEHGRTGLLSPVGDPQALAVQLMRLMADPGLGSALGAAARAEAANRYSFDRMVASFDALYCSELARRTTLTSHVSTLNIGARLRLEP